MKGSIKYTVSCFRSQGLVGCGRVRFKRAPEIYAISNLAARWEHLLDHGWLLLRPEVGIIVKRGDKGEKETVLGVFLFFF